MIKPQTMELLLELPGVARKTANVVLAHAFGINMGVTVDTHVKRLSQRLGLTKHTDPIRIERDLMLLLPQPDWENWSIGWCITGEQFAMPEIRVVMFANLQICVLRLIFRSVRHIKSIGIEIIHLSLISLCVLCVLCGLIIHTKIDRTI
jgi:hypothetical protein